MLAVPRKIPYNISYKKMTLCSVVAGFAAYFFAQQAMTNDRGLSIDYIINFDVAGATIFLWVLGGICVLGSVVAILSMVMKLVNPKELAIDDYGITIPYGFMLLKTQRVEFNEITNLSETVISRQTLLYLYTATQKVSLTAGLLPDNDTYEDIKEFLKQKLSQSR